MKIYGGWKLKYNAAWTQPISISSAQVPPPKVPDLWKKYYLTSRYFLTGKFLPGTFRSWFLRWKHTEYQPKIPSSWGKFLRWKQGLYRQLIVNRQSLVWALPSYLCSLKLSHIFLNGRMRDFAQSSVEVQVSTQYYWFYCIFDQINANEHKILLKNVLLIPNVWMVVYILVKQIIEKDKNVRWGLGFIHCCWLDGGRYE